MRLRPIALVLLLILVGGCTSRSEEPTATPDPAAPTAVVEPPSDTGTAVTGRRADLLAVVEAYDAYHPVPPSDLDERVARLAPRVEEMTPDEFLVAVSRLTAGRDRDGHTGVFPLAQPDLEVWPLQLYAFDDGWRVIRARPPYRHLVGARVTAVGGRSMDEVTRMVAPLVSRDNSATVRGRLPQYLVVPSLLRGLGLRPSLTVGGQQVVPEPISTESYAAWNGLFYPLVCPRLRPPSSPDWTITRSDRGIVARYGLVSRFDDDRTIDAFAARLRRLSRSTEGPIVIDVRDNPGGDNGTYPPLLSALQDVADRRPGRLRVVFGRCTFSAATNFVAELLATTDAVSIGEPMGGAPNMWGDATEVALAHSGIALHVATIEWELGGPDKRPMIKPDVATPVTWADHRLGIDRALRTALSG